MIGVLRVPPAHQVDVIKPVDDEGGLARLHHRRDDRRGGSGGAGETQLVEADAVDCPLSGPADGMRAQQADHDLGGSQPVFNLLLPLGGRADPVLVAPDIESRVGKILLQTDGDLRGILAPIAEEDLRPLGR